MKKICEIYDVSQEYKMKDNTVLICVSDLDRETLFIVLPELRDGFDEIFDTYKWQQYLEINKIYNRNESKHYMREVRQSKRMEVDTVTKYETNIIGEIMSNSELKSKIEHALSMLSPLPRRRFLKHYYEGLTYREIAREEGKAVSTIYESIMAARKKFLKNFE